MKLIVLLSLLLSLSFGQNYIFKDKIIYLEQVEGNTYLNEKDEEVILKENFFIKLQNSIQINDIIRKYNLQVSKKYNSQLFLVKSKNNYINILELIKQINEDKDTLYAYPNFSKKLEVR